MSDVPRPPILSRLASCWGTAHLAWGVAVLAALIYAAQEMPQATSPQHEPLGLASFVVGLVSLALLGWVQIDRGWKLRHPSGRPVPLRWVELFGYLLVLGATWHAHARGVQSRLLATGLDRLLVTACLAAGCSLVLWVGLRWSLYHKQRADEPHADNHLPYWLFASQVAFAALLEWLERQPW